MSEDKKSFEDRVRRVDPDFKPSVWRRLRTRPRRKLVIPGRVAAYVLVFTYVSLTGVKVVMHQELGADGYQARVAELAAGDDAARIASRLLFRDPVMDYVTSQI